MKKLLIGAFSLLVLTLTASSAAWAHVVVRPDQVGIASFQTFTIGVPTEKDNPTVAVRLVIPEGLQYVSPNVKPGWTINVKKEGAGEDAKVTEINWSGGSIPVGQRDDFLFSAKAPTSEKTLIWKAYQTYANGTVVSWDQDPNVTKDLSDEDKEKMEKEGKGSFSQTAVVNDLKANSPATSSASTNELNSRVATARTLSLAAIALSALSLALQLARRKQ